MTTQSQQLKNLTGKGRNDGKLFKQNSPTNMNTQFQYIYQQSKNQNEPAAKRPNQRDFMKKKEQKDQKTSDTPPSWDKKPKGHVFPQKPLNNNYLGNYLTGQAEGNKARPFSSNKFDCKSRKTHHKRGKKLKQNILEYAKLTQNKMSNSKKSTDNSDSSEIQKFKVENQQMCQIIQQEEKRVTVLEKKIMEEERKYEIEKHFYQMNIQKLRKKAVGNNQAAMARIQQACRVQNGEQSDDQYSIGSN